MGCGASRGAPAATTLTFIRRVQKERDDISLPPVQLKRLGVSAYDAFFADFEGPVNSVVELNNKLHDALWDLKVAVAYASSPDPDYGLELELSTNGIRSVPQVLLDVLYADNNSRPQPFEVRHILNSRPAVAAADYAVAQSLQELLTLLQSHPAPAQLSYDDSKQQLSIIPISGGTSIPNAAQQYHRLHQCAARVSSMLVALRNAAPGLRLVVTVVPSPAPGARTFSWRLLSRRNAAEVNNTASQVTATPPTPSARSSNGATSSVSLAGEKQVATPLRVAAAHGSAAIVEAAATVAHQAAAVAAAVSGPMAPLVQLHLEAGRRLVAITPLDGFIPPPPPHNATHSALSNNNVLRSLSLTRGSETWNGHYGAAGATVSRGIAATARADEAVAMLCRAISSSNHALFRLAKCSAAAVSSGHNAALLLKGDQAAYPVYRALALVLEEAIRAARQAVTTAAAPAPAIAGCGGGPGNIGHVVSNGTVNFGTATSLCDLIRVDPQLCAAWEQDCEVEDGGDVGFECTSVDGGAAHPTNSIPTNSNTSSPTNDSNDYLAGGRGGGHGSPLQSRETICESPSQGRCWTWEWGIQPQVPGVTFPDCLPPKAREVYVAVNSAVSVARTVSNELPRLQRDISLLVQEAEGVFKDPDTKLTAACRDMMTAGRMRAALDRNANTISASPALVALLQAAVVHLKDDLRHGKNVMRQMVYGGDPDADGRDNRGSAGTRSMMMRRQLGKAAAVAAAAVAAAAAAAVVDDEDDDESEGASELGSGLGSTQGGSSDERVEDGGDGDGKSVGDDGLCLIEGGIAGGKKDGGEGDGCDPVMGAQAHVRTSGDGGDAEVRRGSTSGGSVAGSVASGCSTAGPGLASRPKGSALKSGPTSGGSPSRTSKRVVLPPIPNGF